MLSCSSGTRIFVATQPVDLRASFNKLFMLTQTVLHPGPALGPLVCVHQCRAQPGESAVLGWQWLVGLRQAIGERAFLLATAGAEGHGAFAERATHRAALRARSAAKTRLVPALKYFENNLKSFEHFDRGEDQIT